MSGGAHTAGVWLPASRFDALAPSILAQDLAALVRARSVTGVDSEQHMVDVLSAMLAPTGCELTVVDTLPGRPSLAAVLRGEGPGALVLNGHMDTVPPDARELWTADPFGGQRRDGAVWGRGAVDMKGGLTCQVACLRALAQLDASERGTLVLHFAAGEETGEPGTMSLLEGGFVGDWGICTEPTDLQVARAQRGVAYFRVRIHGRSAHAGSPQDGRNPIAVLSRLLPALERYDALIGERDHPVLPPATAIPTMLRAGVQQNALPDICEVVVDRRLLPGDAAAQVLEELRAIVDAVVGADGRYSATVDRLHHEFAPAEIPEDAELVRRACDAAERALGRRPDVTGTPYGSDVRNLVNDAGMPAITFGPGQVRWMHCPDEHLPVADLAAGAKAITAMALDLLTDRAEAPLVLASRPAPGRSPVPTSDPDVEENHGDH